MIDLIKKAMFTGIGVATLTKEKIEEVSRDFVEKGKLSEIEGRKLVEELISHSEASKKDLELLVEENVKSVLKKMNIATSSEIEELKDDLKELKSVLSKKEQ
ncbi:MAG: hypothetical protein GY707_07525 [Desulfobacteraceae bacterium]|nr:hypothetical protein [Desulfobacteraceae bacterium]